MKRQGAWREASVLSLFAVVLAAGCGSSGRSWSIRSESPLERKQAVAELGRRQDMDCYERLVAVLHEDPDRLVRSEAAFALARLSEKYYSIGFCPLLEALENDPSAFVRAASALSLSATPDSRAVEPLVKALRDRARGRVALRWEDRVVVYDACVSDAARFSLEEIVGLHFESQAPSADAQRREITAGWSSWYEPRGHLFPKSTAVAGR